MDEKIKKKLKWLLIRFAPPRIIHLAKKIHYVHALKSFDEKAEADIAIVRQLVKKGDYVIDVGAHVGWYTKVFSELVGNEGRVFSIEPIPENYQLLCYCAKKLKLKNIKCYNYAVSERDGNAVMKVSLGENGIENFYECRIVSDSTEIIGASRRYNVVVKRLDGLFRMCNKPVKFVKCDVEGHEFSVLKGANDIIVRDRPIFMVEISGDPDAEGTTSHEVFSYMAKFGYAAFLLDGNNFRARSYGEKNVNYFFICR